jgi:hypothetical protein
MLTHFRPCQTKIDIHDSHDSFKAFTENEHSNVIGGCIVCKRCLYDANLPTKLNNR